ncbi:Na+/H+ antiporter NhaA [Actinomyces sp. ZJ308]|uniref:Na+/H+ antiporter NhaA n=1 Tax=Actinomyces sp. ZJ308 TaxID=2708342 RepID=UPI001FBAE780|nr:Na+/H+ antiporter NhaA [Actinomyces sp. ZJ308]
MRHRRRQRNIQVNETYAATALAVATALALLWANIGHSYHDFWHTPASLAIGPFSVELTLHEWVDEGLMSAFFFMVGLDVRRDLTLGELRLPGRALLPVAAAVGGLVVPALVFLGFAHGTDGAGAWGAVISTDTAFALGMLALIGPKRAPRLRAFLLAFAVIDDIGALLVIAIFYSGSLNLVALGCAGLGLLGIWILARRGVWRSLPYILLAVVTWYALYQSGVHATLAGVLIALLMPVYPVRTTAVDGVDEVARLYRQSPHPGTAVLLHEVLTYSIPMNQRLSWTLPPYVNYVVVPLFALANAGVELSGETISTALSSRIMWAVIAGLVIGKLVGVAMGAGLVLRLVPASRLPGLDMPRILGLAALSGMGFTISLLVANLALEDETMRDQARLGVLLASLGALVLATIIFRTADRLSPLPPPPGQHLSRPVDRDRDLFVGSPDAPHILVNYADMSYEGRWRLMEAFYDIVHLSEAGQLAFVLRHKVTGPESLLTALALEAVRHEDPERVWPLHDALARLRGRITSESITDAAREVGVDSEAMWKRIDSGVDEPKVMADALDVDGLTEDGSTVVYIDGRRFETLLNRWTFSEALTEAELTEGIDPEKSEEGAGSEAKA